jgi:hypothetical protein
MISIYKGSVDDKIVKALTAAPGVRDLVVTVEAGASKIKALVAVWNLSSKPSKFGA